MGDRVCRWCLVCWAAVMVGLVAVDCAAFIARGEIIGWPTFFAFMTGMFSDCSKFRDSGNG